MIGGLALLFASNVILPRLIPTFPAAGAWLGQLLGAAWIGVAGLNWISKGVLIGGIYGRPVIMANGVLYFVTTMVLIKIVVRDNAPSALWILLVPAMFFAGIYGWFVFRGPFEHDLESQSRTQLP